jgi:hypothetical protein
MMELHLSTPTTATATHAPMLVALTAETLVVVTESSTSGNNATKVPTTVTQPQMLAEPIASFHLAVIKLRTQMRIVTTETQVDLLDAFAANSHVVMESDNQTRSVMMDQQTATAQGTGAVSIVSNLSVEMVLQILMKNATTAAERLHSVPQTVCVHFAETVLWRRNLVRNVTRELVTLIIPYLAALLSAQSTDVVKPSPKLMQTCRRLFAHLKSMLSATRVQRHIPHVLKVFNGLFSQIFAQFLQLSTTLSPTSSQKTTVRLAH